MSAPRLGIVQPFRGILTGLGLVLLVMPTYVSFENRQVLGRWSQLYVVAMAGLGVLWIATALVAWRRRPTAADRPGTRRAGRLIGWGVALWGTGYAAAALFDPSAPARLLEADVIGATELIPSFLEWIGLSTSIAGILVLAWAHCPDRFRDPLTLVTTLFVVALAGEGFARAITFVAPRTHGFPTHSEAVWRARYVDRNAGGFRDVDHPVVAPDGVRRAAFVGDSYAFGWGLEDTADRIGDRLVALLGEATGSSWASLNVSESNTHTLQHLAQLDAIVPLRPDIVVLVYVFNDVDYLARVTPASILATRGGGLVGRLHPGRVLFTNSYLFQALYVRVRAVIGRTPAADPYADPTIVAEHMNDLTSFVERARDAGAVPLIVPFDIGVVAADAIRTRYDAFVASLQGRGLPVCPIGDAFAGHAFADLVVNGLDVHPNELGHRLAAEAALPCLLEAGAPSPAPVGSPPVG